MAETKISPYDLPTLKNTTDDALQNYLSSISFKQSHFLTDVRLAIGYIAVLIGAATFLADYKLGWNATKDWTAVAVVVYFGLNGAFTYWMWAVERGVVFEGSRQGKKIHIASRTKKYDPTYRLTVTVNGKKAELSAPFTTWFTADGYFVAKPFQQWLASSVPLIGEADQKNAGREEKEQLAASGTESEVLADISNGSVAATGSSQGKAGGSKRSKRKG